MSEFCKYRSVRVSAHGRLEFSSQKKGVGAYTEKFFVRITHILQDHQQWRRWVLTRDTTRTVVCESVRDSPNMKGCHLEETFLSLN